jgi:glutamine synthetase
LSELAALIAQSGARNVYVAGVDHMGTWRGKRLSAEAAGRAGAGEGVPFSDVFWANTVAEDLILRPPGHKGRLPDKPTGFPDHFLRLEPDTFRPMPWLGDEPLVLGTFTNPGGSTYELDPRACLRRVLAMAADRGLMVKAGMEWEFYVLAQPIAEISAAGFPADMHTHQTRAYTYSGQRAAQDRELLDIFIGQIEASGIEVEAANCETGAGQYEVNLRYDEAMRTGDNAFVMKQAVKTIAAANGWTATFMAKPHETWSGNSGHLHMSLWSPDGATSLFESGPSGELTETAGAAMAGMLATMRAAMPFCCPTVNSYKRLVPYMWGSTTLTWGLENRTLGLRAVEAHHGVSRIEHRLPGGDCNPYLALAVAVAGMLHGIDAGLEPPPRYEGDAYADPTLEQLPMSLDRATDALEADDILRRYLTDDVVDHFVVCCRAEVEHHRLAVSEWERKRYLEMM